MRVHTRIEKKDSERTHHRASVYTHKDREREREREGEREGERGREVFFERTHHRASVYTHKDREREREREREGKKFFFDNQEVERGR